MKQQIRHVWLAHWAGRLFVIALLTVLAPLALSPSLVAQEAVAGSALTAEEQQILEALNARRTAAGLVALTSDPLLDQAAQAHADDILNNRNYSHWGTDGTLAKDRVVRTGYSSNPWVSENWVSASNPERAMAWWMGDYIHRINILTPRWREVGIGVAINYESGEMVFVTVFSRGRDAQGVADPVVTAAAAAAPIESTIQAPPAIPGQHTVQPGDTLLAVALQHGHSTSAIAGANAMNEGDLLQIGQVLRMPGYADELGASVGGIGGLASEPTLAYQVSSGETLFSIAARHGVTWQELARMNGLGAGSVLQIGQTIQVPLTDSPDVTAGTQEPESVAAETDSVSNAASVAESSESAPVGEESASAEPAEAAESVDESPEPAQYHLIGEGDTVIGIAQRYGIAWGELLEINGLDDGSILQPGRVLRLR